MSQQGYDRGRGRGRGDGRGRGTNSVGSQSSDRGRGRRNYAPSNASSSGGYARSDRGRGGGRGRGRGRGSLDQGGIFSPVGAAAATIDERLTDDSQDVLVRSLQSLKLTKEDLPVRPGFGTDGRAVKLRTNFFAVKVPKGPLYEYDMKIKPEPPTKGLRRRIIELAETMPDWADAGLTGRVAHDYASRLISAIKLALPIEIKISLPEDVQGLYVQPQPMKSRRSRRGKKPARPNEYTLSLDLVNELETQGLVKYVLPFLSVHEHEHFLSTLSQHAQEVHVLVYLSGDSQYRSYPLQPIISALNIVLAAHPSRPSGGGVVLGRNKNKFFHPSVTDPSFALGGALEAFRGFYASVRPAHKQLMVNVNVCTMVFYIPGNLAERWMEFRSASWDGNADVYMRGIRVKLLHLARKKTVKGLSDVTAKTYVFEAAKHGRVTVEEYFRLEYNTVLRYPDLPLVDFTPTTKRNLTTARTLIPMEVCEVLEMQPYRGDLVLGQQQQLIRFASRPPNVNGNAIVKRGLDELGYAQTADPLSAFGISIGKEMSVVPGRILSLPRVRYASGASNVSEKASWNLRGVKFVAGATLTNWAVLVVRDGGPDDFGGPDDPDFKQAIKEFVDVCKSSGITVQPGQPSVAFVDLPRSVGRDPLRREAIKAIKDKMMTVKPKPIIFLVILSDTNSAIYDGLKHLCDLYLNVGTVCMRASNVKDPTGRIQRFANVALKFNSKLGGVNHKLEENSTAFKLLAKQPTMLVGMDVTHPTGKNAVPGTPSIAAVVGSTDASFSQFPSSMYIQKSGQETIEKLKEMLIQRLEAYRRTNEALPARILVYRDGVSESQLDMVINVEMDRMLAAFKKFNTNEPYRPKLTIVVCGKRHHTRFYPTEGGDADENGNPRPGTVVDRGITAIYDYDFYLQAHGGLKGTTRPTHYYVVHDEIGFSADELQRVTNDVSYLFARATKAVSLVSPAYYADLACYRGRCYLRSLLNGFYNNTHIRGMQEKPSEDKVMEDARRLWRDSEARSGRLGMEEVGLRDTMFYL